MISNKFSIDVFYTAFKEACGEDFNHQVNHGVLDNTKFFYAIVLLSKVLYADEVNPFEAMFQNMLVDKIVTSDKRCKFKNITAIFKVFNHLYSNWRKASKIKC